MYDDTKRDKCPQLLLLTSACGKQQKTKQTCVFALSHPHRGGVQTPGWRQNLSRSLCMAQTGASQAGQTQEEEKEVEEEAEIWTGALTTKRSVFCVVSSQQAHHPFTQFHFLKD